MSTTTLARPVFEPSEGRLLLHDVVWDDYEAMLRIVGDRRIRVTYDGGTMEVGMPSQKHEQAAQLLGLFVPRLAEELEIPYEPLGMTTWKKPDAEKGLEPDQCYYIQNQAVVREREVLDLDVDPPPDLAIEVDITSSSLNRMAIYAGLGVPEVWRYDGRAVTMHGLHPDGTYHALAESRSIPRDRHGDVVRFLESGRTTDKLRWARELRDWVRDEFLLRRD
jgi:Uma2 family endonuclease